MLRRASLAAVRQWEGAALASQGLRAALLEGAPAAAVRAAPLAGSTERALPSAAHILQQRQYAQQAGPKGAYTPPAALQRPMAIRNTLVSPNLLAEPYKGEPPKLPLSAWFSVAGWKERWRRWLGNFKSIYTVSKAKKHIPGWALPAFKEEVLALYKKVNKQLAAGDRTQLRHLVTPSVFSELKRQIRQREEGGWANVQWSMAQAPTLKEIEVVHGRLIALDPKDDSTGFVQFTVKFPSTQRFAAYDKRGNLVAGGMDKEVSVTDYWVFEHALKQSVSNRWRVAALLSLPPPDAKKQLAGGEAEAAAA